MLVPVWPVRHNGASSSFQLQGEQTAGEGDSRALRRKSVNRSLSAPGAATRGVLFVHAAPSALCPHVEWAVAGVLGVPVDLSWTAQPARAGTYRAEHSWTGPAGTGAALASALRGWAQLLFEVTEDPTATSEGTRFSFTPELGIFAAATGLHGDVMIPEDRLKAAVVKSALGGELSLLEEVERLLGKDWDEALEPFRYAGVGAPVRWLHHVV
jgi:uncharacterized protein DUF3145